MHRIKSFGFRNPVSSLWIEMGIAGPAGDGVSGFAATSRLVHAGKESASADPGCAFSSPRVFHSVRKITGISAKWMMAWLTGRAQDNCRVNESCGRGVYRLGKHAG